MSKLPTLRDIIKKPPESWTLEDCSVFGDFMTNQCMQAWNNMKQEHPVLSAINAAGMIAIEVFMMIPLDDDPSFRIEEFDNWVKYTRGKLIERHKESLS